MSYTTFSVTAFVLQDFIFNGSSRKKLKSFMFGFHHAGL
jgi:hypothetical protein